MPSLSKQLKGVTDCVIGLQYVWEYRSPSKSVPPHYQCKLCAVSRLQHDMLAHVRGWKHSFRYLKKAHPDKVTSDEVEANKDPAVRKTIKEIAAEVEKTEGRGQLKVILKEPCDVPAFEGLRSAAPKIVPLPPPPGMGPHGPPFGPRFSDHRFPGDFPPPPFSDYPLGEHGEPDFGGYSTREIFPEPNMGRRSLQDGMGRHPAVGGDSFGSGGGMDSYGRTELMESPRRRYSDEYRGSQMGSGLLDRPVNKPLDRPGLMGASDNDGNRNTLLTYLDTFRIENESDAQLVLKVTQKLTDVLMEYRLRSVSSGSTLNSLSMSSGFSSTPSRLPSSSDGYLSSPLNSLSGPSRYSDGPSRYYK
ncbi:uncharacterized protein si:ch211-197h24.6 isoform X2 [Scomber japonicus]|nr:uncharacterized protein si:ch211-197h24.6 isoform X2 [Scomber japonicus]